jgi:PadR family transcriptional regulator, regulatory protein PadR
MNKKPIPKSILTMARLYRASEASRQSLEVRIDQANSREKALRIRSLIGGLSKLRLLGNDPAGAERLSRFLQDVTRLCYRSIDALPIAVLWLLAVAKKSDLLPGTLDMLILKKLSRGPMHGYGIALSIKRVSEEALTVEEGSLYPALQRLLLQGWVKAQWKMTATNRRARYYTITAMGRKQLGLELSQFEGMIVAITRILQDV